MAVQTKMIGPISAYAIAVQGGYMGTKAQWAAEIANAQSNAQLAQEAADTVETLTGTLPSDFNAILADFAPAYSASSTYAVGEYVFRSGQLYQCTTAVTTAADWDTNSGNFTAVTVGGELSELSGDIVDLKSTFVNDQENKLPYFIVKNEYINAATGAFQPTTGWDRTELIPLMDYSQITVKSTVASGYNAWYKADKTYHGQINVTTTATTLNIPKEAKYAAFSNSAAGMAGFEASFVYKDDVKITNLEKCSKDDETGNLPLALVSNEFVNGSGVFAGGMGYSRTGYVYVGDAQKIVINTTSGNNYNAYYNASKTLISTFTTSTGENIIDLPSNVKYIALSNTTSAMLTETVRVLKYREPDYEYSAGHNVYNYPDIPSTTYSYDSGVTYSVEDGIITLNGSLTQTTFVLDLPEVTLNGYNIFNVEQISGSYTGSTVLMLLPTTNPPYIINIDGHITRLDHFDNDTRAVRIYASNNTTFSNLKFRIWIVPGLVNQPFDRPHYGLPTYKSIGCTAGEYNTPDYPRIGDGTVYSVFGDAYRACKDGMLSRTKADATVKFGLLADLHYGYQSADNTNFYKRVYQKLTDAGVDFCVMLGDIIDSGYFSTSSAYHGQMTQYKNSIKKLLCPNYPFAGNHDDDVSEWAHHGVIDYGDVRLIDFWADYDGQSEGGLVKDSELTWLEDQLKDSTAKINILMCHYAVSTDAGFGYYIGGADQRAAIEALASTYGVKLYLNGHEHDHDISVGDAGVMKDINLPNGQYAYGVCTISGTTFTAVFYDATTDATLKTVTVDLS